MTFHGPPLGGRRRRPLSQDEINTTAKRIGNIVGDPAGREFNDDQFNAYSSRQISRNMDIGRNIIDNRIETFKPEVTRRDLNLDGSVGDQADNFPREVFAVKKVLSKAGAFTFDVGNEPTTVPNDLFKTAIRNFQTANDLKVDGLIRSGGPTIHMLGRTTMGQENGKPSGFDAADFKAATGRDPNLSLSGKAIFKTVGKSAGAGSSGTQVARGFPRGGLGRGGKGSGKPWLERQIEKQLKKPGSRRKGPKEERSNPEIGETPAHILRYSDGRVYIVVNKEGKISLSRKEPGAILIEPIRNKLQMSKVQEVFHGNYPDIDDRRSFQEREAAGLDGYVYGPVWDKNGKKSYKPLIDPTTGGIFGGSRFLRIPVKGGIILTLAQIKAMGLSKWHVPDR